MKIFVVSLYPQKNLNTSPQKLLSLFPADCFIFHIPKQSDFSSTDVDHIETQDVRTARLEVLKDQYETARGFNWFAIIALLEKARQIAKMDDQIVLLSANTEYNHHLDPSSFEPQLTLGRKEVAAHVNRKLKLRFYLKLYTHRGSLRWLYRNALLMRPWRICKGQHEGLAFGKQALDVMCDDIGWSSLLKEIDAIKSDKTLITQFPFGFEEFCFPTIIDRNFHFRLKPLVEIKWNPETQMFFDRPFFKIVHKA